jgi:hypothetical protein
MVWPIREEARAVRDHIRSQAAIPEDRYGFRAAPETRTVAQILTHIAVAQQGMPEQIHALERRTTLEGLRGVCSFILLIVHPSTSYSHSGLRLDHCGNIRHPPIRLQPLFMLILLYVLRQIH